MTASDQPSASTDFQVEGTFDYPDHWGNDELEGFVEVQPPEPISWYPQTAGWSMVAAIVIFSLFFKLYRLLKCYLKNAYRRAAEAELINLEKQSQYQQIPRLLRRTALYAFPRKEIAHLVGHDWELWLDGQCQQSYFSTELKGQLAALAYRPGIQLSQRELGLLCQQAARWIKHHRGRP